MKLLQLIKTSGMNMSDVTFINFELTGVSTEESIPGSDEQIDSRAVSHYGPYGDQSEKRGNRDIVEQGRGHIVAIRVKSLNDLLFG